jgi:hypothetical protein
MLRHVTIFTIGLIEISVAHADGLTPAGPATVNVCYASGSSGPQVPCVLLGQTWVQLLRPTDSADGLTVVGRSLSTRAQEEINALDNGVVCDGVTDNAAALANIQGKISPGKTIYFPPASQPCMTSVPLSIEYSNVMIRAAPGTVVLKPLPTNVSAVQLLAVGNANNVVIYGITLDGGGATFGSATSVAPTAQAYNVDSVVFDTVTVQHTPGIGVNFSIAKFSGVRNSTFRDIGNRWKTTGNAADRSQAMTWSCAGCASGLIATLAGNFSYQNVISDIGLDSMSFGDGVNIAAVGNRCEMTNNQVSQVPADAYAGCIYTNNVTGATITGNYSEGATGNAIDIYTTTGFTISGNFIRGSGQAGVGVFGSYGSISGNTILNSAYWSRSTYRGGVTLSGPLTGVSVQGNLIADTLSAHVQPFGVHGAAGSCTGCTIANNTIAGMATADYGGYLTGPTVLPTKAGGTGLDGGPWKTWVPVLTATGGAGVTFNVVSASYEQVGKTVRGRLTLQVIDTGARPNAIDIAIPGGQTLAGGTSGSAANYSSGTALQLASNGSSLLRIRALTPGGAFLGSSGEYLGVSFEVEVH